MDVEPKYQIDERRAAESAASAGPSSSAQASGSAGKPTVVLVIGTIYALPAILFEIITLNARDFLCFLSCVIVPANAWPDRSPQQPSSSQHFTSLLYALHAGMAGSGKTTLLQRITAHLSSVGEPGYILNLDPAVMEVPYGANIDIRDTVSSIPSFPAAVLVFSAHGYDTQ